MIIENLDLAASGVVHAEGILDWVNGKTASLTDTLQNVGAVAVIAFVLIKAVRSSASWAVIVGAIVIGGIVLWAINGGVETVQGKAEDEIATASVVVVHDAPVPPDLR